MNPNEKNEFERQLAEKFNDFHPDVPAGMWDRIATQLDAQQRHPVIPLKKGRRLPTRWMTVAASLLMVCGIVYWYNRPIPVTYLQGRVALPDEIRLEPPVVDMPKEVPAQEPNSEVERIDVARLKRLFAKKDRQRPAVAAAQPVDLPADTAQPAENQQLATHKVVQPTVATPAETRPVEQTVLTQEIAAVPDIQPLVVLEVEEETLLAAENTGRQPFGISNILNYVVGTVDQREEKLVTFSNDNEGSLKLDFNFSLAKNRKKKIK